MLNLARRVVVINGPARTILAEGEDGAIMSMDISIVRRTLDRHGGEIVLAKNRVGADIRAGQTRIRVEYVIDAATIVAVLSDVSGVTETDSTLSVTLDSPHLVGSPRLHYLARDDQAIRDIDDSALDHLDTAHDLSPPPTPPNTVIPPPSGPAPPPLPGPGKVAPGPVQHLSNLVPGNTSIRWIWGEPLTGDPATEYEYERDGVWISNGLSRLVRWEGLDPGLLYTIRVRAKNDGGTGPIVARSARTIHPGPQSVTRSDSSVVRLTQATSDRVAIHASTWADLPSEWFATQPTVDLATTVLTTSTAGRTFVAVGTGKFTPGVLAALNLTITSGNRVIRVAGPWTKNPQFGGSYRAAAKLDSTRAWIKGTESGAAATVLFGI